MKLTKSLSESLIREALEETGCRGRELEEGNCVSEEEQTLEEKKKKKKKKSKKVENPRKYKKRNYDRDGDGVPNGADSKPDDGSKS